MDFFPSPKYLDKIELDRHFASWGDNAQSKPIRARIPVPARLSQEDNILWENTWHLHRDSRRVEILPKARAQLVERGKISSRTGRCHVKKSTQGKEERD